MAEPKLFESAITVLKAEAEGKPAAQFPLDWLSDLNSSQAAEMAHLWRRLPVDSRRDLMGRLEEEARENFEVDFLAIARISLNDSDAEVRVHAVRSFWECGDAKLVDKFIQLLEQDPDPTVRASAATALGPFVERTELEELPAPVGARIVERLIAAIRGQDDLEVRRRAVESIGYSSDPRIRAILENAHAHTEALMRGSALRAMGRSANPSFAEIIAEELRNPEPYPRSEAARAAGALGMQKAVPQLIELLDDVDGAVRAGAIEALGELGGEKARGALERMQSEAAGEEWERIETALENAEFQDSLGDLPLLDVEPGEDEDGEEPEDEGNEEEEESD